YDWHKAMFAKQDSENSGWGSKADIIALTITVLGNSEAVRVSDLMSSKQAVYQKAIDADKSEGGTYGINGTPGSIIGKTFINGAQSYSTVKAAIEKALGN
ncbi:MAG: thioredoxin domain-containing protein, partial [Patescibacteria group bacterium]